MTTVVNLATGTEYYFDLPPLQAVKAAYLQGQGNYNTWEYESIRVPLSIPCAIIGDRRIFTILCGDYSTLLIPTPKE